MCFLSGVFGVLALDLTEEENAQGVGGIIGGAEGRRQKGRLRGRQVVGPGCQASADPYPRRTKRPPACLVPAPVGGCSLAGRSSCHVWWRLVDFHLLLVFGC